MTKKIMNLINNNAPMLTAGSNGRASVLRACESQVLVREAVKKPTPATKVTHRCNIIPNLFSVSAAQSWLLFPIAAVKWNTKNEGHAMVQASCEPKNRGRANHPIFT